MEEPVVIAEEARALICQMHAGERKRAGARREKGTRIPPLVSLPLYFFFFAVHCEGLKRTCLNAIRS